MTWPTATRWPRATTFDAVVRVVVARSGVAAKPDVDAAEADRNIVELEDHAVLDRDQWSPQRSEEVVALVRPSAGAGRAKGAGERRPVQ